MVFILKQFEIWKTDEKIWVKTGYKNPRSTILIKMRDSGALYTAYFSFLYFHLRFLLAETFPELSFPPEDPITKVHNFFSWRWKHNSASTDLNQKWWAIWICKAKLIPDQHVYWLETDFFDILVDKKRFLEAFWQIKFSS